MTAMPRLHCLPWKPGPTEASSGLSAHAARISAITNGNITLSSQASCRTANASVGEASKDVVWVPGLPRGFCY
jgi:hypothetical protein